MPPEADAAELRALQRKAYGQGGELTDAEAERLRDLENPSRSSEREDAARTPSPRQITEATASGSGTASGSPESARAPAGNRPPEGAIERPRPRRWVAAAAAASVLLFALGVGAGWVLFAPGSGGTALTAEQQRDLAAADSSPEERERLQELFDEGFEAGASVIGYFAAEPVWLAQHAAGASFQTCLIIDGAGRTECGPEQVVQDLGLRAAITDPVDPERAWVVEVGFTRADTPYLTIVGNAEVPRGMVEPGERIELGGEHGDPIEVTIPSEPDR